MRHISNSKRNKKNKYIENNSDCVTIGIYNCDALPYKQRDAPLSQENGEQTMKIAIIEDEQVHSRLLADFIRDWAADTKELLTLQCFESAGQFLFHYEAEKDWDLLFVDIQMEGMNGMELARKIRQADNRLPIVFTTGLSEYMAEGYEVEALHYLLKPLSAAKVAECLDKALVRRESSHFILLHTEECLLRIAEEQIACIEARGHGCIVTQTKEAEGFLVRESISELMKLLTPTEFIRCHRSYLCRTSAIYRIGKTELILVNQAHIPVSRRLYQAVNRAFIEYYRDRKDGIPCRQEL